MLTEHQRRLALGMWGETTALSLLKAAGFENVKDINLETHNHPFGDLYAERRGQRFLIGVKTRNMYQANGRLNESYNIRKSGMDVAVIASSYSAQLAWVALQVIPERQLYWAYFGTIASIEEKRERYSVPTRPTDTERYECLACAVDDRSIRPEWSNRAISGRLGSN